MLSQLSIFVENKVGSVHEITHVLYESGINLRAIQTFDSPDFCILRIVVDQLELAKKVLMEQGFAVKVSKVLALKLIDKPGELDRVLGLLANHNLSINYIYSFVLQGEKAPLMVMNINDMEKAREVLLENKVCLVD